MRIKLAILAAVMIGLTPVAHAQTDPAAKDASAPIAVSKSVQLLTGDTWRDGNTLYRLYGVQACLRGTIAADGNGKKDDCGNVSLAHLAALLSSATVTCQPIGYAIDKATFVVCAADLDGNTIDVGTALISTGYAFAAMNTKGEAISTNYLIAEINAKMEHDGLWATTFQHPVQLLLKQAQERKK
ncbi:MAG: thermonuclease family protein [Rhizobiaceae bacterium]|nr:MAG: thermonuclease family protein [Rhizobiaceae bacterium]